MCLQVNRQGFVWSARTSAAPEQLFLRHQARSPVGFTVDYQKTSLSSGAYVMGSVKITNTNDQVASVPGLTLTIAGQGSNSGISSGSSRNGQKREASTEAQVDCLSGQANVKAVVPFKVPSKGQITCT
jgi:hypothetical protein